MIKKCKVIIILFAVFSCFFISACKKNKIEYVDLTIHMDQNVQTVKVEKGSTGKVDFYKHTKAYYSITGFYDAEENGILVLDKNGNAQIEITKSMELYAYYEGINIDIVFIDDGVVIDEQSYQYGDKISSYPLIEDKEGLTFYGWQDSSNTIVSKGVSPLADKRVLNEYNFPIDENDQIKLYPKYETSSHIVTFDYNDGTGRTIIKNYLYNQKVASSDYDYDDNGKQEIRNWSLNKYTYEPFDGIVKGDITLYAIWVEYKEVTFHYNDENVLDKKVRIYKDDDKYEPDIPEIFAKKFIDWYDNSTFSGIPVSNFKYETLKTNYYAQWELIPYNEITYYVEPEYDENAIPCEIINNNPTVLLSTDKLVLTKLVRGKYDVFEGWYADADFKTLVNQEWINNWQNNRTDLTLYAKWKTVANNTITYVLDDSTLSNIIPFNVVNPNINTLPQTNYLKLSNPTRSEYDIFLGWYADENYQTLVTQEWINKWQNNRTNLTLYAKWDYVIYYNNPNEVPRWVNVIENRNRVLIDFSSITNTTLSQGTYSICAPISEVIFIGDPNKTYTNLNLQIYSFTNGQKLKLNFNNFNFISNDIAAINLNDDNGVDLTIDFNGTNNIKNIYPSGSVFGTSNNKISKLTFIGTGKLYLNAGNGTNATQYGGNGTDGGVAIFANNLVLDMPGYLYTYGGNGGNGKEGANNSNGGNGGNGGYSVICDNCYIAGGSIEFIGGNGGNGAKGADISGQAQNGAKAQNASSSHKKNLDDGGKGYTGSTGAKGGNGGTGGYALNTACIEILQNCAIKLIAGNGGNGGNGGKGQKGGNGGAGGSDDCECIGSCFWSGNIPGDGGKGGTGGNGGKGGDAGNCHIALNNDCVIIGKGQVNLINGNVGNFGIGGAGGDGGAGGAGGSGGNNGANGTTGAKGENGKQGASGASGSIIN